MKICKSQELLRGVSSASVSEYHANQRDWVLPSARATAAQAAKIKRQTIVLLGRGMIGRDRKMERCNLGNACWRKKSKKYSFANESRARKCVSWVVLHSSFFQDRLAFCFDLDQIFKSFSCRGHIGIPCSRYAGTACY